MSLLGNAMGGGEAPTQEFRFNPMSAQGGAMGNAMMTDSGINLNASQFDQGARSFFQNQFGQAAADPMGQQNFGAGLVNQAQGMFNPALQGSMNAGFQGSQAALGQLGQQSAQQQQLFGGLGMQGMNAAFGAPSTQGFSNMAGGAAAGLLGQTDLNQLAQDRTAQLTALARPGEERAVNSKFSNLFSSGRLGTSGGAQALGALSAEQEQAATGRGLAGMNFAEQVRNANLQNAQGFLGQGMQGIGQDQRHAMGLGQMGQQFLGQVPGMQQNMFNNQMGLDTNMANRADQRMDRVQGLFGFGQQQFEAPTGMAARTLTGMAPLDARLMGLGDLSVRASNAASGTASSGGSNPMGNALMGLGSGLFDSNADSLQF
jgi:hypothetical protein